jgi:hypothetical protein
VIGIRFTTDTPGHSDYFAEADTQTLENMASIAVAHYGNVERRPPDDLTANHPMQPTWY